MEIRDSNGTVLTEGDNVTVIKDLKVKGTSATIKREIGRASCRERV